MRRCALLLSTLIPAAAGCATAGTPATPDYHAEAMERLSEAQSAEGAGDHGRALALYRMATDLEPELAEAHLGRARLFERMNLMTDARQAYAAAVYVAGGELKARSHFERGLFLQRQGRHEAAVLDFELTLLTLKDFPNPELATEALVRRARSKAELRRWEEALGDLEMALHQGPSSEIRERAEELRTEIERRRKALQR